MIPQALNQNYTNATSRALQEPPFHTWLFVASIVLPATVIAGDQFGLPAAITGKRLGVLLSLSLFVILHGGRLKYKSNPMSSMWTFAYIASFCWAVAAVCFGSHRADGSVKLIGIFLLYPYFTMTWANAASILERDKHVFLKTMVVAATLAVLFVWYVVFRDYGFGQLSRFKIWRFRNFVDDAFVGGLNRLLTSLMFLNVIPSAIALSFIRLTRFWWALSVGTISCFLPLPLLSGSRQTIVAFVLFVLVAFVLNKVMSRGSFRHKWSDNRFFARAMMFFAGASILVVVLGNEVIYEEITDRLVYRTRLQFETNQSRLHLMGKLWTAIVERPIFGVGGDWTTSRFNPSGIATHNGYAFYAVSYGVPSLLPILAAIGMTMREARGHLRIQRQSFEFALPWFSFLVVHFFWSCFFNDVLDEYFVGASVAILGVCCYDRLGIGRVQSSM